jgi:hypothetical protein
LATNAGFRRVRLVDDTRAALLGSAGVLGSASTVLVYSWGAGSFSATVWAKSEGCFAIVGQEGDRELGGMDVDARLADHILEQSGIDVMRVGREALTAFVERIECAKRERRVGQDIQVSVDDLFSGYALTLPIRIAASAFEEIVSPSVERTMELTRRALQVGGISKPEAVLVVGGSVGLALPELNAEFGGVVRASDEAVAMGALQFGVAISEEDWQVAAQPTSALPVNPEPATANYGEQAIDRQARSHLDRLTTWLERAQTRVDAGCVVEAVAAFEEYEAEAGRLRSEFYVSCADILDKQNMFNQSLDLLRRAHQRATVDCTVATRLAIECYRQAALVRANGEMRTAYELLRQGVDALTPFCVDGSIAAKVMGRLYHLQGVVLCELRRPQDAVPSLQAAVRLDPDERAYVTDLAALRDGLKKSRIGPNERCPCGSSQKYKKCCGKK